MELLGHMVTLCLTFEELPDCFPKWLIHHCQLSMRVSMSPFICQHLLLYVVLIVAHHPSRCEVGLSQDSKCSPLKASGVEHLFTKLSTTCLSSLEKCLLRSFAAFPSCFFFFKLLFTYLFGYTRSMWQHTGSLVAACKLSCGMWNLVP